MSDHRELHSSERNTADQQGYTALQRMDADQTNVRPLGDGLCTPVPESPQDITYRDETMDVRCPTSMECEVNPDTFPGEPFSGRLRMDLEPSTSPEDPVGIPETPETEEMTVLINPEDVIINTASITTGKRPRSREDSDIEVDSDLDCTYRLRPRKARVIEESATEEDNKPLPLPAPIKSPPACVGETTTGEIDTQQTDVDSAGQKKKRLTKKKSSPIAPRLHPLPDLESLKEQPIASLSALAMDWLDDIELIRRKSNLQGVISKYTRMRIELLQEALRMVHNFSLRPDNPDLLKLRNARLVSDNHALQRENDLLKLYVDKLTKEKSLSKASKMTRDAETAPMAPIIEDGSRIPTELVEEISWIKNKLQLIEADMNKTDLPDRMTVQSPLPQRSLRPLSGKPVIKSIVEINSPRKIITVKNSTVNLPIASSRDPGNLVPGKRSLALEDSRNPAPAPRKGKTKNSETILTFNDVLTGPCDPDSPDDCNPGDPCSPGGPAGMIPASETENKNVSNNNNKSKGRIKDIAKEKLKGKGKEEIETEDTARDDDTEGWKIVEKNRKRKRKRKKAETEKTKEKAKESRMSDTTRNKTAPVPAPRSSGKSSAQLLQKRIPKSSAVVIKGKDEGFSYADALTRLRNNIPLEQLGIASTKIKKTANGAVLIEVLGNNNKQMAEELRVKATEVLGVTASITRPEVKGCIRVVGFDESVSVTDIMTAIAKAGGCETSEVTVTPITPMRNGLFMTWVRCPALAALAASERGKLAIGWTMVRLELQKPPTPRCFRCWQTGHHKSNCTSEFDYTNTCFRCGSQGHKAAKCTKEARCVICEKRGLPSRHRLGAHRCDSNVTHLDTQQDKSDRGPTAPQKDYEDYPM